MEQYISKAAVVAEIRRIMAEEMSFFKDCCKDELENTSSPAVYTRMEMLLSFLNTLEVKEVDLNRESAWKPSDGQMKALADALSLAKNCGEEGAFDLRVLYEQLEKLKGE